MTGYFIMLEKKNNNFAFTKNKFAFANMILEQ